MFNQSGSRRWTHFHSALHLAIQRSARKWTFDDFAECFPLLVDEDRNSASTTFNSISEFIESVATRDLDKVFKDYKVQENIDLLHKVINDAKERSESRKDVWQPNLEPRVATAARTIPVFESEVERLRKAIAEIEDENRQLQTQIEKHANATDEANKRTVQLLDKLDNVYGKWVDMPSDDMEAWTAQTLESLKSPLPP